MLYWKYCAVICHLSSVSYMDCIDAPATDITTIYEVLMRALKIKESLILSGIVCVFDQSIFAKAAEIKWKHPDKFKSCILMLGTFHMIMMFLSVISKRFKDAGLRDVLVQSGIIAAGSVEQAISGKMQTSGIRCYKLMYEALCSILLDQMEEMYENDSLKYNFVQDAKVKIKKNCFELKKATYNMHRNSEVFKSCLELFIDYKLNCKKIAVVLQNFGIAF